MFLNNHPVFMVKYFVATTGSNTNNGTSLATPFLTLKKACDVLANGDEIEVLPGTYANQPTPAIDGKSNFKIYGSGYGRPLLVYNPDTASVWNGLDIKNSNNFTVSNLQIRGDVPNLNYNDALAAYNANTGFNAKYDMNGIALRNCYSGRIFNCIVEDCPGGGIAPLDCDLITIDFCLVDNCTAYSQYGNQGISFLGAINSPGAVAGRNGLQILNCTVKNCVNQIPWRTVNRINEGNGIYSDTTKQNIDKTVTYTGKFLFRDNVCVGNGAAGVQALNSCPGQIDRSFFGGNRKNVDTTTGEIQVNNVDVDMYENDICTDSDRKYLSAFGTANVSTTAFKYNYVRGTTAFEGSNVDNQQNTFA